MQSLAPDAVAAVRRAACALSGGVEDFAPILQRAQHARLILLGEASHGTHEFYRVRAEITKALIRTGRVGAVVVEADWPDAWRVHRHVTWRPDADEQATDALAGFRRFPQWMWRNADVLDFVGWLRAYNGARPAAEHVGFFGMDLYSLHASMEALVGYLETVDAEAARRARARYACLEVGGRNPQRYGRLAALGLHADCEAAVLAQLEEMQRQADAFLRRDGLAAQEDRFFAEQNARLVRNAERYYRAMFGHPTESWNVRDRHMMETVERIVDFHARSRAGAAVVLWAHNSHLGDARATEMHAMGEINVGQLARERFGAAACLVGFTTYTGSVTAASNWDEPAQCVPVRPALAGSYEWLFHQVAGERATPNFLVDLTGDNDAVAALRMPRLERAIGVIYRPHTERQSHYFQARLPEQFDLVLHYDTTRAVEPLEHMGTWARAEPPETYPSAL